MADLGLGVDGCKMGDDMIKNVLNQGSRRYINGFGGALLTITLHSCAGTVYGASQARGRSR